jgi:hypothetical protein
MNSRRLMPIMRLPPSTDDRIVSLPSGKLAGPWGKPELF